MYRIINLLNIKTRPKNKSAGITITEVVVASSLMLVAIVPILKGLTRAHFQTTNIERKTRSLTLAQLKLDQIKAESIYDYTNGGSGFAETDTTLDGSYLCNVTDDKDSDLKTIVVTVGYDSNGDSSLAPSEVEVTLTTMLAKRWGSS